MDLLTVTLQNVANSCEPLFFLSLCTGLTLIAFNHPNPDAVQTTAVGLFFPNCGVHTFLLLLLIAFGEVVVRDSIKQSW